MKSANLIVFEGVDGVGKSTLARALVSRLETQGVPAIYYAFPGRAAGSLGLHIYDLHHNMKKFDVNSIDPLSLQMLHVASHIDAINTYIKPLFSDGKTIVLDRFWWSTLVYGRVYGIPEHHLLSILSPELEEWASIVPRVIFLISRTTSLRSEEDEKVRHNWLKLKSGYEALAQQEGQRQTVITIENETSQTQALEEVYDVILSVGLPAVYNGGVDVDNRSRTTELSTVLDTQKTIQKRVFQSRLSPIVPSEIYDTYWMFAAERQEIFFRRLEGMEPPWTTDVVLSVHKFTNAYRASDRVSQYLIKNVIYHGEQAIEEVFFRILLFKLFNKIETWQLLLSHLGEIAFGHYTFEKYDAVLTEAIEQKKAIFSGAYIMPSGGYGFTRKHRNCLRLLETMMSDEVPNRVNQMRHMRDVFELLRSYPLLGDFLAYQFTIDLNYSSITSFSEMEFVVPGPGAKDGIQKCFTNLGGLTEAEIIQIVTERQEDEFKRLGINFRSLWGRSLQLVDCQNLFCEVDKYARVVHPTIKGRSTRTRIKQIFRPNEAPISYWYPPKWGLNSLIPGVST